MNLPKRISPCPIIEAVFEVRFEPLVPRSAVFGIFYNQVKNKYTSQPESLPLLQIPEQLRNNDPNLKYKPHFKISSTDNIIIQIGPSVLSVSVVNEYIGWALFSKEIYNLLDILIKMDIMSGFPRLGIRYVNFFEYEIFDKINIEIKKNDKVIEYNNTILRTGFNHDLFKSNVLISNEANFKNKKGSTIDIDTYIENNNNSFDLTKKIKKSNKKLIEQGHTKEKELFYSLLKNDFLEKLNPKY